MTRNNTLGIFATVSTLVALVTPFVNSASAAETVDASGPAMVEEHAESSSNGNREPAATKNRNREDDEYNFSWLDPDKKVYVLQNRRYRKAFRPALYLGGGFNLSNPFRSEYSVTPRLAFWFSEQLGFEAFFAKLWGFSNSTFEAIKGVTTGLPFVREVNSYYGGLFTWTPYYAKLNFFNKILYLDWFLNAGLGQINTTQNQNRSASGGAGPVLNETLLALFYGTGWNFYITNNFLFRTDVVGIAYRAKGADNATERTKTHYDLTVSLGYKFF